MTERELASNIMRVHGRTLAEKCGGSAGGITISEKYAELLYKAGGYSVEEIGECAMALRHWVEVAAIENGKYICRISNYIQNC